MTSTVPDVPWQELEHAFGRAYDVPRLLTEVSQSRGWKLKKRMEALWERVLHQGSIYSASPPAVEALIPMAASASGGDRKLFYEVLTEFASSARQAISDGRAIPCCSGGDPVHGRAILTHILEARDRFVPDLTNRDGAVRGLAGSLLCCSADAGSEAAHLVRNRFDVESDPATRIELLEALTRVSERITDWTSFLVAALQRESDPALRFALRHAQIRQLKSTADEPAPAELISLFLAECESGDFGHGARFFEALQWLGPERELAGLLQVLESCGNREVIRPIAGRVLRLAFDDRRSGWERVNCTVLSDGASRSAPGESGDGLPKITTVLIGLLKIAFLMVLWKIFPFLLRRRLGRQVEEKNRRRYQIEYGELQGSRPELPIPLTMNQQRTLTALAAKAEVWMDRSNLWSLFGLPDNAADLRAFLATRA